MVETLNAMINDEASLWLVFAGSLVAATLIPFASEALLLGALTLHPHLVWPMFAVATAGNTIGGMMSYGIGRFIPHRQEIKYEALARRYGAWSMLLSWLPVIGDALCVAAGWLRLAILPVVVLMAFGKAFRYLAVIGGWMAA
ncbi:MAG: YqaA family protein [Burkholderiales bacterium]